MAKEAGTSGVRPITRAPGKEDLALAIVERIAESGEDEVGPAFDAGADPATTLLEVARQHAVYCRDAAAAVVISRAAAAPNAP